MKFTTNFICVHESGHVIAARAYGIPVTYVSWDPHFIKNDPAVTAEEVRNGAGLTVTQSPKGFKPIMERGFIKDAEEELFIRGFCVHFFAGPMAEDQWTGFHNKTGSEGDLNCVFAILSRLDSNRVQRRLRSERYAYETWDFVSANYDTILNFACELYNQKTILEPDIDPLIA